MGLGPTKIPLNFEIDLDHYLDVKRKKKDFLIYSLFCALADVYAPRVLLLLLFYVLYVTCHYKKEYINNNKNNINLKAIKITLSFQPIMLFLWLVFTPQPLSAVRILFSPMVSRWMGRQQEKFVRPVSQKL